MKKLLISKTLALPLDAVTQKLAFLGPNLATRQVIQYGKKDHILNVCEEHFRKEAS